MRPDKKLSLRRFLPRTLLARSLLILITPVFLIQIITSIVFLDRHWSRISGLLSYAVAGEIALLTDIIDDACERPGQCDPVFYKMVDNAGQKLDLRVRLTEKRELELRPLPQRLDWEAQATRTLSRELSSALKRPFTVDVDLDRKQVQVQVASRPGILEISFPGRRLFSSSAYIFLLWLVGTSLVLLVVAIIFMRNQIRPIRRLAIAADRFGKGRDAFSFKPSGAREVRQASEAFIEMGKRIRRQMEQRALMLAGVSHDLRTPLTRLKLHASLQDDNADAQAMKRDIQEMERMIEGYLDFVRGAHEAALEQIEINSLIKSVLADVPRDDQKLETRLGQNIKLPVRPLALKRCLTNIVGNAMRYADHIRVETHLAHERYIDISVEDNGPGIPEDQYDEVFRPFTRLDKSRNIATGGVGLGLPIAMDIVHAHGGKIWLEASELGGLKVIVRLPL